MRRYSLFSFVICMPLVAGIVFAVYSYRTSSVLSRFHTEIDNNRLALTIDDLHRVLGEKRAREIVERKAYGNDSLFYDGDSRIVQIVRSRHIHDNNNSDRLSLRTFELGTANWVGPSGMCIDSVTFDNDTVYVRIYGDMQWSVHSVSISKSEPVVYAIRWVSKTKPVHGVFTLNSQGQPF